MEDVLKIRFAKSSDLLRIVYITKIGFKKPFVDGGIITKPHIDNNFMSDFFEKKIHVLVAEINGKIVGAVKFKIIDNKTLYLYQLVVLKTYRCKKIGELLINKVENWAKKYLIKKITLDCMKEKYLDKFYLKLGYEVDSIKNVKDYHMVYMSKLI